MFTTLIQTRDFSRPVSTLAQVAPTRYSWNMLGGPEEAALSIRGHFTEMLSFMGLLRHPITIYDGRGVRVWWGFIYSVEVRWGSRTYNVSLGSLGNRVAAVYSGTSGSSKAKTTTSWVQNDDSVSIYGTREKKLTLSDASAAEAESRRNMFLDYFKYPRQVIQTGQSQGGSASGYVICKGWWYTANWKYYSNAGTATVDTGTQIGTIAAATGQFFTTVSVVTTGITSSETRDGNQRGGEYINELMKSGTSDSRILVSSVSYDREFSIQKADPEGTLSYYVDDRDRWLALTGASIPKSSCPIGVWYRIASVPAEMNAIGMLNPIDYFIGRSEYNIDSDTLVVEPYGEASPFQVVTVE